MTNKIKLLIVGGGPIGIACALAAKRNNIDALIIEKGCLSNALYNYPVNMRFFSTSEKLEIGNIPFVSIQPKPMRDEALEYYRRVATDNKLQCNLFEEVLDVKKISTNNKNIFEVKTTKNIYQADYVILSSGYYGLPNKLNVEGENLPKVTHYYRDPFFYAMQKVIVVGSQNSAIDAALETWRKGAEVTMVIRQSEIGKRVKYWIRPDIINRIEEGSIKAYFNSTISNIREKEVDIQTPDGKITIANDWVIAMTGYLPDIAFMEKIGIKFSTDENKTPEYNPATHESNIEKLFLAGVVCGGKNTHCLFIENSREHADKIIAAIKSRNN